MRAAVVSGYIVTVNKDGSVPLNSKVLAKVDTVEGAQILLKFVNSADAFVVRAIESHEPLVEAVEWAAEMMGYAQYHLSEDWARNNRSDFVDAYERANAALQLAKGGA